MNDKAIGKMVRGQRRRAGTVLLAVIAGLVGAAGMKVVDVTLMPDPVRIATVDIDGMLRAQIDYLQESGMTPEKAEAYAELWGPLLDDSLAALAADHGVVLMVSPSVVAGAPDLTHELKERMRHETQAFRR